MVRIENDPTARMKVLSRGEIMAPARCCVCGSSTHDRGYLDIGVYFDYEGQMYLCMDCAYQAGETVGLFTPEEVKHLQDQAQSLAIKVAEQEKELRDARPIVDLYRTHVLSDRVVATVFPGSVSPEDVKSESANNTGDVTEAPSGRKSGESESKESTPFPGRPDPDESKLRDTSPAVSFK